MSFKVGDTVRICHSPISLLKSHADKRAEIIQKGFGSEWLLSIDGSKWWAKEFDFEKDEDEEPLPFFNNRTSNRGSTVSAKTKGLL